jgi:hypothetical protein
MRAHSGEGDPMDSDAWRPFDPVDVKRRVGGVEPSSDGDDDYDGDFASGDSDYTWLDVGVVTFITLRIDAGA